ncbi:hypothetical protein SLEP1_g10285 [Rubroshorea leprosula]|uniref:DUF4220 domain-containing protein n=1 Tax=Rubroshorea leprosula TaxID=152421 RepID=A0AAV5IIJ5_9ROSI|nr:hypothetical protein SLEP1_g10285 [Rubroshorea leprosula]
MCSFNKTILFLAFLTADWIAIATLGKLSSSCTKSLTTTPSIRTYWAPLLLLHLGGPDSITAYALEDNKNWITHLIILVIKVIFIIMSFSRLSFLIYILFAAGISKNVEKIWCLKLVNSQKAKPIINIIDPARILSPNENIPNLLRGYLLFIIMRPDVNDYLSSHNLVEVRTKITTHLKKTTSNDTDIVQKYICASQKGDAFGAVVVALGFTYDVVYTKAALIFKKLTFLTRHINIISTYSLLVFFMVGIVKHLNLSLPKVDIVITMILFLGAYAIDVFAIAAMFCSNWTVLEVEFGRMKMLKRIIPLLSFAGRRKMWPIYMGTFDLLEYCCHYKRRKANQSCGIPWKITNWSKIEMCHKTSFTNFVDVPNYLKQEDSYKDLIDSFFRMEPFKMSRGKKALQDMQQFDELKWSIELEFDHSIIVWHLATNVCYSQEDDDDDEASVDDCDDPMKISQYVSDYMMYLLAMCPALLLSKHTKSFWFDHTYDKLKELLSSATDTTNAAFTLLNPDNVGEEELESSMETTMDENLQKNVSSLVRCLNKSENKWKMIRDVWIEMLVYAAVSSQHISHVKQLGEGMELLSLIWLLIGSNTIRYAFKEEFEASTEEFESETNI